MKRMLLCLLAIASFGPAAASGQELQAGVMIGPSWAVGSTGSNVDAGFGGEIWVAVDLPALPVTPRAALAAARFSGDETAGDLDTRSGRLDLLLGLPGVLPGLYGFLGAGIHDADYESFTDAPPPIESFDPELAAALGAGARVGLGRVGITFEGRYLTVPAADFQTVELRLGVGL